MSTFKRLLNVGKGKAKVARRDLGDTVRPGRGGLLDDARHAAADTAEAFAEAIRPEADAIDEDLDARPREPQPTIDDDDEPEPAPSREKPTPRKRRL